MSVINGTTANPDVISEHFREATETQVSSGGKLYLHTYYNAFAFNGIKLLFITSKRATKFENAAEFIKWLKDNDYTNLTTKALMCAGILGGISGQIQGTVISIAASGENARCNVAASSGELDILLADMPDTEFTCREV